MSIPGGGAEKCWNIIARKGLRDKIAFFSDLISRPENLGQKKSCKGRQGQVFGSGSFPPAPVKNNQRFNVRKEMLLCSRQHNVQHYTVKLLLAEKIKMADGHQENTQSSSVPETNESASNDVDEADEVNFYLFLTNEIYLLLASNKLTFSLHIYLRFTYSSKLLWSGFASWSWSRRARSHFSRWIYFGRSWR